MYKASTFPHDTSCPCFNCQRRTATCKIDKTCTGYSEWKAKKEARNEVIFKAKQEAKAMDEIVYRNYPKMLRKHHRRMLRGY